MGFIQTKVYSNWWKNTYLCLFLKWLYTLAPSVLTPFWVVCNTFPVAVRTFSGFNVCTWSQSSGIYTDLFSEGSTLSSPWMKSILLPDPNQPLSYTHTHTDSLTYFAMGPMIREKGWERHRWCFSKPADMVALTFGHHRHVQTNKTQIWYIETWYLTNIHRGAKKKVFNRDRKQM